MGQEVSRLWLRATNREPRTTNYGQLQLQLKLKLKLQPHHSGQAEQQWKIQLF
jgi:hypothetical protein